MSTSPTVPPLPSPVVREAASVLFADPRRAEQLLRPLIDSDPQATGARLLLAVALRRQRRLAESRTLLETLIGRSPGWAAAQFHLGATLAALGETADARARLLEAQRLDATLPGLQRELGHAHHACGDRAAAEASYRAYLQSPAPEPWIDQSRQAVQRADWREAEFALRAQLGDDPVDVLALMLLADVALACAHLPTAGECFAAVLARVPTWLPARCGQVMVLMQQGQREQGYEELNAVLAIAPEYYVALSLNASALVRDGEFGPALACYAQMLEQRPEELSVWVNRGTLLRNLGHREDAIAAFRHATELRPTYGEAWWGLANLKRYEFDAVERMRMQGALAHPEAREVDRVHLHFALGRASEDAGEAESAFRHYTQASALWCRGMPSGSAAYAAYTERCKAQHSEQFFADRHDWGADEAGPVFIVGMPRSGSTLVEQVLASHTQVEGTMELVEMLAIASRLAGTERAFDSKAYPAIIQNLDRDGCRKLGEEYLARTRHFRRQGRPLYTDKTPNNYLHTALIHLALPKARIIDVRRHPMACGWSNFTQHYAYGQLFSYDLSEMGVCYREYVRLMAHYDAVLPGRVHRVYYERLLADPETEIRSLLNHCGLPFDERCLRFHENERFVATPSAEQVRRPLDASGIEDWRAYEAWLSPLRESLGEVLTAYPDILGG